MSCVTKSPPKLENEMEYEVWREDIDIWCEVTDIPKVKQAMIIRSSLSGRAKQAASQLSKETLKAEGGVKKLLEKLDELFLRDKGTRQFAAFRDLYNLRRRNSSIEEFVSEFEHVYFKFTAQKMSLPDCVMAFVLLESCSLSDTEVQMVMSAINEVTYNDVKSALKRIFAKDSDNNIGNSVKTEPALCSSENEVFYGNARGNSGWRGRGGMRGGNGNYRANAGVGSRGRGGRGNYRGRGAGTDHTSSGRGGRQRNPLRPDGTVSRCAVCGSLYHWVKDCPHANVNPNSKEDEVGNLALDTMEGEETDGGIVHLSLFMGFTDGEARPQKLDMLVKDAEGCALIDTGCSTTVCGDAWFKSYIDQLSYYDKACIEEVASQSKNASFTFGDGKAVESSRRLRMPCYINGYRCTIETDIVSCNIPLLLSKKAMKKAKMILNFENDTLTVSGKVVKLSCASSGHYLLPLYM